MNNKNYHVMAMDAKNAEIKRLRAALVIIANPLADFIRQAEKDVDHLSPLAISLANDPEYLKEVARTALKERDDG
jgi:hypothetical protein